MKLGATGHQNIPPQAVGYVKNCIKGIFSAVKDNLTGTSSLAAGADQLFASLILEYGGRLNIIIPCEDYETTFTQKTDLDRYWWLLSKADNVETLNYHAPSEDAYLDAGHRIVDNSDLLIAVWDGKPARGKGGTADIVYYAKNRGIKVEVVWPDGVTR